MHPNPVFRTAQTARNLAFARAKGFGVLAINGPDGPLLSHIPFLLAEDGATLWLHLLRSNPIARLLDVPHPARLAISGPDGYVSPDWYGVPDQVPTWNYIAVHLTGPLELLPQEALREVLDRQTGHFEDRLAPKTPWTTGKMTPEVMERMMRSIVPCRMQVTGVDGTWKLNQNKADDVRLRAADHLEAAALGSDAGSLARLMRDPDGQG